jgi:hypothetical protein
MRAGRTPVGGKICRKRHQLPGRAVWHGYENPNEIRVFRHGTALAEEMLRI